ncbi:MAG: tyrosine-type recombinase/integrase [Candidatus Niyogibacteria bacterium]|nr:tyrosine-type recombinase/integrase [Candidatus Niyogibacteria bacterium]
MKKDIQSLHKEFLEYLEIEKGRSLKTVENYDRYLKRFLNFSKIKEPREISDDLVRRYRLWLNRQKAAEDEINPVRSRIVSVASNGIKRKTQNYYLIGLRAFLKYLIKRGIEALPAERIELAKTGGRELDLIDENELERLLEAPAIDSAKGLRDKAILELLFSTGLRVSELCELNQDSISLEKGEFSVRGKGEKVRVVFLSGRARQALKNYLEKRGDLEEALFINFRGKKNALSEQSRLTSRSIERLVQHYAIKAGISRKVTPHILRHVFATDLLANGADLRSVQALLGHANITTTQIYTHVTDKQLREVHSAFHGKRRKR